MKNAIIIENCTNFDVIRHHEKYSKYIFVDVGSDEKLLSKYKLDYFLKLYENEEIIVCKEFTENSQTFVTDGNWMVPQNRIFPEPKEFNNSIVLKSNKMIEPPFISNNKLSNLFKIKKYEDFCIATERYKFENPNNEDIFLDYYLAMTYFFKLKNNMQAQKYITFFISNHLNFAEGWCLLGDFLVQQKRNIEAIKAYENAIEYGKKRNIYDGHPVCLKRYTTYPEEMLQKLNNLLKNTSIVSIDHL
jgi:tetratricopeptide (TPR) repeat protein